MNVTQFLEKHGISITFENGRATLKRGDQVWTLDWPNTDPVDLMQTLASAAASTQDHPNIELWEREYGDTIDPTEAQDPEGYRRALNAAFDALVNDYLKLKDLLGEEAWDEYQLEVENAYDGKEN